MENNLDKVVHQLSVEDLQNVAEKELGHKLTAEEVSLLEDVLGDYIPWYDCISTAINENIIE